MKNFKISNNKSKVLKLIDLIYKCNGHCPCAIVKDETTLCPCDNFTKNNICQCGMYEKIEGENTNELKTIN